ncbi:MAG: glycerophosphodiester phosphodiesterase family protein, partial [Cyanobacteria bacterium J06588_5]
MKQPAAKNIRSSIFQTFKKEPTLPVILGHRGMPEEHQENTMAGFKRAVELGLDGVELDVFLTKDNKLIVFHDLDTERLTGV